MSERKLYAYLFGVHAPVAHVMGNFVSVLRNHIAGETLNAQAKVQPLLPLA